MRGAAKAFAIGGSLGAFFYLMVTSGLELGFRARTWVARRREARERTET